MRPQMTTIRPPASSRAEPDAPVLVVDDELPDALQTEQTLIAGGYQVEREPNGDAALASVRSSLLRVVVSELYIS